MKRTPTLTAARYSFPDPGELKTRVTFRKRLDAPANDWGTESVIPEEFKAWAKVAQTGATTYQASVETGAAISHLITIRYTKRITSEWELILPSGEVLRVRRQRDLNHAGRFWLLECDSLGGGENYTGGAYG